jgi:hypothetical protein
MIHTSPLETLDPTLKNLSLKWILAYSMVGRSGLWGAEDIGGCNCCALSHLHFHHFDDFYDL